MQVPLFLECAFFFLNESVHLDLLQFIVSK